MSLKIRLARGGAKKRPFFRIVLADSRSPRDGRFIERLGTYNPLLRADDPERVKLKEERIRHWLSHGALPTDRVARFLGAANIIAMPAPRDNPNKGRPKAKAQERLKAAEEAAKAAAEAPPAEAETETPPAEAPAEEAATEAAATAEETASEPPAAEATESKESPEAPAEEAVTEEIATEATKPAADAAATADTAEG